jgi:hypothetical protein
MKLFTNSQQIDYATNHGNSYADSERNSAFFFYIFHSCSDDRRCTVTMDEVLAYSKTQNDCSRLMNAIFATNCLLEANQGNYVRGLFLKKKKKLRVSLFIGIRITTIRCVVYLLHIFKMFHGLMNNLGYSTADYHKHHKSLLRVKGLHVLSITCSSSGGSGTWYTACMLCQLAAPGSILVQPTDMTCTQYTKFHLCNTSRGWASNAWNM